MIFLLSGHSTTGFPSLISTRLEVNRFKKSPQGESCRDFPSNFLLRAIPTYCIQEQYSSKGSSRGESLKAEPPDLSPEFALFFDILNRRTNWDQAAR